jgi:hypothetical protein
MHGWDMRMAFDEAAALSECPLSVLMGLAQRWLSTTFHPALRLVVSVERGASRTDLPHPEAVPGYLN